MPRGRRSRCSRHYGRRRCPAGAVTDEGNVFRVRDEETIDRGKMGSGSAAVLDVVDADNGAEVLEEAGGVLSSSAAPRDIFGDHGHANAVVVAGGEDLWMPSRASHGRGGQQRSGKPSRSDGSRRRGGAGRALRGSRDGAKPRAPPGSVRVPRQTSWAWLSAFMRVGAVSRTVSLRSREAEGAFISGALLLVPVASTTSSITAPGLRGRPASPA